MKFKLAFGVMATFLTVASTVLAESWKPLGPKTDGVKQGGGPNDKRLTISKSGWYQMTNDLPQVFIDDFDVPSKGSTNVEVHLDMNGWSIKCATEGFRLFGIALNVTNHLNLTVHVTNTLPKKVSYIDGLSGYANTVSRGLTISKAATVHLGGNITFCRLWSGRGGSAISNWGKLYISKDVKIGDKSRLLEKPTGEISDANKKASYAEIVSKIGPIEDFSCVTSGEYGGGIYNYWGGECYISGGAIEYCGSCHFGGGICCQEDVQKFVLSGNVKISHNKAPCGGGVEIGTGSKLIITNQVEISNNESTGSNENDDGGGGVAVGLAGTEINRENILEIYGGTIVSNKAETGGGIYMRGTQTGKGRVLISGGLVADNNAQRYGGAIYTKGPVDIASGSILRNSAIWDGGGVYVSNESTNDLKKFTMTGGVIADNCARYGGGVYAGQEVLINGGLISNNVARLHGGGVYVGLSKFPFMLENGDVVCNVATNHGGGFYIISSNEHNRVVNISGGTTKGNRANQNGGGFYVSKGLLTVDNGYIEGNDAGNCGGGIFANECNNLVVTGNVIVAGNNCGAGGGGFYVKGGNVTVYGGNVLENQAENNGGGFHLTNSVVTVCGGVVSNNVVGKNGGGFYACCCKELVLTGGVDVVGNKATKNGGGLAVTRITNSVMRLSGGAVHGNVAEGNGGGFWLSGRGVVEAATEGKDAAISGSMLVYENKACNGGGFYMCDTAYLKIFGGVIYLNEAASAVDLELKTAFANAIVDRTKIKGCGGGIYLEQGKNSNNRTRLDFVENTNQIGIYLNVASNAADDVLAEGNDLTRISYLPTVDRMVLDYAGGALSSGWYEDYFKDETEYGGGTAVKKAEWEKKEYQVERYREAGDNVVKADEALDKLAVNGLYTKYACLTLGFLFPIPAQLWITDHEDVGNGVMNLQFEPIFTNKYAQTEFIPRWAEMAVEGKNLYAAWADKQSDIEKYIDERHEPGEETTHTRLVRLRDNNKETACKNGRIWITLPLRDHQEEKDGSKPLLGTTSRYYRLFVEKIEDVNQEASN